MNMSTDDTLHAPALTAPFDHLRSAMAGQNAPRGVEKELMDAFAQQFPPRRWYHAFSPAQWGLASGAGGLALAALLALLALMLPPQAPDSAPPVAAAPTIIAAADEGPAFVALQSMERIEQEANPRVLEADVPRTALASLGLPVSPEQAGDSVRAEMLVGADGSPLALRLVSLP
jgi:hypothetical protein